MKPHAISFALGILWKTSTLSSIDFIYSLWNFSLPWSVKCEVEKLLTEVDTLLHILWYNYISDRKTRQKFYEVVDATKASHDSMSMPFKELIRRLELP